MADPKTAAPMLDRIERAICRERCAFMGEPPCWDGPFADDPWPNPNCDDPGCHALALAVASDVNKAADETERLRSGVQAMLDGNYPHPRTYRSTPGMSCPHGQPYYEECEQCNEDWLWGLLSGARP